MVLGSVNASTLAGIGVKESAIVSEIGHKSRWAPGSANSLPPSTPDVGGMLSEGWRKIFPKTGRGNDGPNRLPGNHVSPNSVGEGTPRVTRR